MLLVHHPGIHPVLAIAPLTSLPVLPTTPSNGTPRQPLLVGAARCRIQLVDFPAAALDGLDQYSHVWVLYLFHANTGTRARPSLDHWLAGRPVWVQSRGQCFGGGGGREACLLAR